MTSKLIMGIVSGWAEKFGFTLSDTCEQHINDALARPLVPDLNYLVDHSNLISLYAPDHLQTDTMDLIVIKCERLDPVVTASLRIKNNKEEKWNQ